MVFNLFSNCIPASLGFLLALVQVICVYDFTFMGTGKCLNVGFQMHLEFMKPRFRIVRIRSVLRSVYVAHLNLGKCMWAPPRTASGFFSYFQGILEVALLCDHVCDACLFLRAGWSSVCLSVLISPRVLEFLERAVRLGCNE